MPDEGQQKTGLTKEQKIGFILLLFFAFFTIVLGALQIRNTMYAPFALSNTPPTDLKAQIDNPEALRFRDTDKDGLSDFDEIYVYSTSQYLADTDSDGTSDFDEVKKGMNPNCPEGKDCSMLMGSGEVQLVVPTISTSTASSTAPVPEITPEQLTVLLQDPKSVRQMLIEAGMDKTALSKISDVDLLTVIQEAMNSSTTMQMLKEINLKK